MLGRYLQRAPAELRFAYGEFGKPALRHGGLHFNLSNSGPVALLAFSADREVGIDVELDEPGFAVGRIPERFFSEVEVRVLRSLSEPMQARAFLNCWTRKEAFIKARGDGLSLALDSFDVSLAPGGPAMLLRTAWSSAEHRRWWLCDRSDDARGYVAAIALRGKPSRIVERDVADVAVIESRIQEGKR